MIVLTSRRSLLANLGILALLGGGAWWARDRLIWPPPTPQFLPPRGEGWIPFAHDDQPLITLMVGVGGVTVNALVDSGAQFSTIDLALADHLGLSGGGAPPMLAMGVGGAAHMARNVRLDLEMGPVRFSGMRAAALDLSSLSRAMGRSTPMIVGFDVLSALLAEFDFPRRRMRFSPRADGAALAGQAAPVRRRGRALVAEIAVEGTPLEVLVDTGSTGLIGLSARAARDVGLEGRPARRGHSVVLGGEAASQVVAARDLTFAGQVFRDIDVHIVQLPDVPGFPSGLLGVEALRRHHVVMDAGGGVLRLVGAAAA